MPYASAKGDGVVRLSAKAFPPSPMHPSLTASPSRTVRPSSYTLAVGRIRKCALSSHVHALAQARDSNGMGGGRGLTARTYSEEGRNAVGGHGPIYRQQVLVFPKIEEVHAVNLDGGGAAVRR